MYCKFYSSIIIILAAYGLSIVDASTNQPANDTSDRFLKSVDDNLRRGFIVHDDNFTFGFSGNISEATTVNHNFVVACQMISSGTCRYYHAEGYTACPLDFRPRTIPINLCTHILFFDLTLNWKRKKGFYSFQNTTIYNKLYNDLHDLKSIGNTKILLQILDTQRQNSYLSEIARKRSSRIRFIKNAIKYLRENELDGLDVDIPLHKIPKRSLYDFSLSQEFTSCIPLLVYVIFLQIHSIL